MNAPQLRVLSLGVVVDAAEALGDTAADWADVTARLAGDTSFDVVLVDGDACPATSVELAAAAAHAPVVVVVADPDAAVSLDWLRQGADEVAGRDEIANGLVWRRARQAAARRSGAAWRGAGYSTDQDTGLPHRQQLVEHLSQLLALREREPSPMAVLALRVVANPGGGEPGAASSERTLLRRKVGVRLRAGVRASDIVASIDDQAFAVLLGSILAPGDADRVAAKLVAALVLPFSVGGEERSLSVAFGIAQYPQDGRDAEPLLRRALALAEAAPAVVGAGPAVGRDSAGAARTAANDDA
ncbi:MAG: diguanylate cyclase [Caldimonas sp.]